MKNLNHQQFDAFKNFDNDADSAMEKVQPRGRSKPSKKSPNRKTKTSASVDSNNVEPRLKTPKTTARKSVSRFMNEGQTIPREALNESLFGHDDYQFRQEFNFNRFATGEIETDFPSDTLGDLPREIQDAPGMYTDQHLVQEIRRAIERDSSVSSTVHKIQMTAKNGIVILKGTVESEQEQMIIEDKAVALAGFGQVVNQLEVIEDIKDILE